MKKWCKKIIKELFWFLPPTLAHKLIYKHRMKKSLNLNNPIDFNEKIHWLIVFQYRKEKKYGILADKIAVREFIIKKGYEKILPKIYGVYDHFDEIDFHTLPKRFVLKPNNGCGNVFLFLENQENDISLCKKALTQALKQNFAKNNLEYHYSFIKPKIFAEEYLEDSKNAMPIDYKFYCFDGEVHCILVCSDREKSLKLDYYDTNWNYLDYSLSKYRSNLIIPKPENLKEMIHIAEDLSKEFAFVRVDLYNIKGKIYFGELTFTPAGGFVNYNTKEALVYLGGLLKINRKW